MKYKFTSLDSAKESCKVMASHCQKYREIFIDEPSWENLKKWEFYRNMSYEADVILKQEWKKCHMEEEMKNSKLESEKCIEQVRDYFNKLLDGLK